MAFTNLRSLVVSFVLLIGGQCAYGQMTENTSRQSDCSVTEGNGVVGILHALSNEFEGDCKSKVYIEVSRSEYSEASCLINESKGKYRSFIIEGSPKRFVRLKLLKNSNQIVGYDVFKGQTIELKSSTFRN